MKSIVFIITSITLQSLFNTMVLAQDITTLPTVTITEQDETARKSIIKRLIDVPGDTNFIDPDKSAVSKATLKDVLGNEPGVIMQSFFGGNDQPRLNIRGSGIQDNPVNRGIQLLYDGLPINQPDGSFVIGLLPSEQARFISVYRGANALQYGGSTLGGAINLITRTGHNSKNFARIQGGSFDSFNSSLGFGAAHDQWDYYIGAGHSFSDGFRHHSKGRRTNVSLNAGYKFNNHIENRIAFHYTDNYFQIPFVVQKQIALNRPKAVLGDGLATGFPPPSTLPAPAVRHPVFGWNTRGGWDGMFNVYNRNPRRNTEQFRLANTTHIKWGNSTHTLGLYGELLDDTFTDPLSHTVRDSKISG